MIRVGHPTVRHVHRRDAHSPAARRHGTRFGFRKAGATRQAANDILKAYPRQNRHAVPLHLAVRRHVVTTLAEFGAEQRIERIVGELRLLQANDVGTALVEPRQEPRNPLLDRVDVPRGDPHVLTVSGRAPRGWLAVSD